LFSTGDTVIGKSKRGRVRESEDFGEDLGKVLMELEELEGGTEETVELI